MPLNKETKPNQTSWSNEENYEIPSRRKIKSKFDPNYGLFLVCTLKNVVQV